ncbi:hypothetical protein L6164_035498 [Bauhinia variegata]|uniref:Uncharacterized protein n=1 Tax=Bauhinia variegata TaxID=167791 RepID=A0ACB9KEA7_BAUVA|nr:hypothetical protein L6164_035498 [Bauhinia variegata]
MSPPTKRSATNTTDTTTSTSSSSATRSPPMKKAKSQAVACSLDTKKGLRNHHPDFNSPDDAVFDPTAMTLDEDLKNDDPTAQPNARGVVAANLSRKKATPPQPAKKLVIKLVKGKIPQFFS